MTEENQEVSIEERKNQMFAELQRLRLIDLSSYPYRLQQQIVGTYKREDLKKYLQTPEIEANQKQLRKISRYLFNASNQYKRLIWYWSNLLTLDHYVEPYGLDIDKVDVKKFKKQYQKTVDLVELFNIKHEFKKMLEVLFRDGIYVGYLLMSTDSSFFLELNQDYVKITYHDDGSYGVAFNFQYFYTWPEHLEFFPPEFKQKFNELNGLGLKGKKKNQMFWDDLDIDKTICLKLGEFWYPIPPFVALFDQILNITDFKDLEKAEQELGNYKLLFQKIPMGTKDPDEFMLTEPYAKVYHKNIQENLPPQVGIITGPMEVTDISFERDTVDKNKVSDATSQFWDEAGVNEMLFSGKTKGSIGLIQSIKVDETVLFGVLRQIERWLNRFLKQANKQANTYKYRIVMPDFTELNIKEKREALLKSAQYGLPVKSQLIASHGMQPSSSVNMSFLENTILELDKKFIPLVSSHTQTSNDKGGAPQKDVTNLTESGAATADKLANQDGAN